MSRPLLLLGVVYVLIAALVMPGSLLAAEEGPQKAQGDAQAATATGQPADGAGEATAEVQRAAGEPPASGSSPGGGTPAEQPPGSQTRSLARAAASGTVVIRDFEFAPRSITVNAGDTVTWANNGPSPHSATANNGSFDTGVFGERRSRSHRFEEAGTFTYYCRPHPSMKGSVTVRGASAGDGGGADSDAEAGASSGAGEGGSGAGEGGSGGATGSDAQGGSEGAGGRQGARLPASGAEAGILAGLGLAMLALGTAMRRRTARGGA